MLTNLAIVFICVRASSALVRTSDIIQPVVRGQVYIFEISPPLNTMLVSPLPVFTPEGTIGLPSVRPSVRPSVSQSVSQSVSPSVCPLKIWIL